MTSRPAVAADFPTILALNEESVHFLSPLTAERLAYLDREANFHQVLEVNGEVVAFLLAFREGADYDSVNYRWFAKHYAQFLYIDRVVVAVNQQSLGIGSQLYRAVFAHAAAHKVSLVTCEFDIDPPNPISERFHTKLGFEEVGRQPVADGKKWVSLQAALIR